MNSTVTVRDKQRTIHRINIEQEIRKVRLSRGVCPMCRTKLDRAWGYYGNVHSCKTCNKTYEVPGGAL